MGMLILLPLVIGLSVSVSYLLSCQHLFRAVATFTQEKVVPSKQNESSKNKEAGCGSTKESQLKVGVCMPEGEAFGCADVDARHQCTFITCLLLGASLPPVLMVVLQRAAAAAVFALPHPPSVPSTSYPSSYNQCN